MSNARSSKPIAPLSLDEDEEKNEEGTMSLSSNPNTLFAGLTREQLEQQTAAVHATHQRIEHFESHIRTELLKHFNGDIPKLYEFVMQPDKFPAIIEKILPAIKEHHEFITSEPFPNQLKKSELGQAVFPYIEAACLPTINDHFLHLVIRGNQDEAEKMLRVNPELLLIKAIVTDYSDRKIEGTAFQLALGADDVEMSEMIAPYFDKLPGGGGPAAKEKQIKDQFPTGEESKNNAVDSAELKKVVQAISDSATDADCEAALQAFKAYLKPKDIIQSGKHFNTDILIEAFKLYDEKYNDFGGWDSRRNNLFWRQVIGNIQCCLPSCYAQAFCQGLYAIVEDKEKLERSFGFRYSPGTIYFPLDSDPNFRLGVDFAGTCGGLLAAPRRCWIGCDVVEKLCRAKTDALRDLMQRPGNQSQKWCSIM
jgi:hypothetical protein